MSKKTTAKLRMSKNRVSITTIQSTFSAESREFGGSTSTEEMSCDVFASLKDVAAELASLIANNGFSAEDSMDITNLYAEMEQDMYSGDQTELSAYVRLGANLDYSSTAAELQMLVMKELSTNHCWQSERQIHRAVGLRFKDSSYLPQDDKRIERPALSLVHSIVPTALELMHRRIGLNATKESGRSKERTASATLAALRLCKKS